MDYWQINQQIKRTWEVLLRDAKNYRKLIVHYLRMILTKEGIDVSKWGDEELILHCLFPSKKQNIKPWVSISSNNGVISYTTTLHSGTFDQNTPDTFLTNGRWNIVKDALTNPYIIANSNTQASMIAGVYAEQTLINNLQKFFNNNHKYLTLQDFQDTQLRQLDFTVQFDNKSLAGLGNSSATKNVKQNVEKLGIAFDYKPDISSPFAVATYVKNKAILDKLNKFKYTNNTNHTDLIGLILYDKYYGIQPLFYSNKNNKGSILLPDDFFRDPKKFYLPSTKIRVGDDVIKQTAEMYFETEEWQTFEEAEKEDIVNQMSQTIYNNYLLYAQVMYKGKGK